MDAMRFYQPVAGPDGLPQAMIEGATEYDWAELPEWLKDVMRHAADELRRWDGERETPIKGELVNEIDRG